jgi:hypothetical protein
MRKDGGKITVSLRVPEDLHKRLQAHLYSPFSQSVPYGAYSAFFIELASTYFRDLPTPAASPTDNPADPFGGLGTGPLSPSDPNLVSSEGRSADS